MSLESQILDILKKALNPLNLPTPKSVCGQIMNLVNDALDKAKQAATDAEKSLGKVEQQLQKALQDLANLAAPVQKVLDKAIVIEKAVLSFTSDAVSELETVGSDVGNVAASLKDTVRDRADDIASRLGAATVSVGDKLDKLEQLALDGTAFTQIQTLLSQASALVDKDLLSTLRNSIAGDGTESAQKLVPLLREMVSAANALPAAGSVIPAQLVDWLDAGLQLLPSVAYDVLATLAPLDDLQRAVDLLKGAQPAQHTERALLGASPRAAKQALIIASAALQGISAVVKMVPKIVILSVEVGAREGAGIVEKGGAGVAAGAGASGGLRVTESLALVEGVKGPSPVEVVCSCLCLLLDEVADILSYAAKRLPGKEVA